MITPNPQYALVFGALLLIVLDAIRLNRNSSITRTLHYFVLGVLVLALVLEIAFGNLYVSYFQSTQYSYFVNGFILFIATLIYAFMLFDNREHSVSIDIVFIISVLGATLTVLASNFMSLLISVEMLSVSAYAMVFFEKNKARLEGAMKYIVTSVLAFILLIFGISLIYVSSGSLSFSSTASAPLIPTLAGIALVVAGLAFKGTLVPFHMWAPDVYQASFTPITAFLTSVSKAAVLIAMIRVFFVGLNFAAPFMTVMFMILAVATIFLASFLAMVQENIKRLLVYSSIAQAGFAFIGIALLNSIGVAAAVFYVFSFAIADALVFLAYSVFEDSGIMDRKDAHKMSGVSKLSEVSLFIGVLSLAGVPPTIGFFGKLLIFASLLTYGYLYIVLLIFFIILFSTFFYLGLLRDMKLFSPYDKRTVAPRVGSLRIKEIIIMILLIALFAGVIFA
jgi:NADH-quinone oxidoreductase subunit N